MSELIRIYICGPMSGMPELNFPAFDFAARFFRSNGVLVENPTEIEPLTPQERIDLTPTQQYRRCLPKDFVRICECDALVGLPGWEESRGTAWEMDGADLVGIPFIAPDYTSDEFPGELTDYLEASLELLKEELCVS